MYFRVIEIENVFSAVEMNDCMLGREELLGVLYFGQGYPGSRA